jgi:hypothetical protein
LAVTHLPLIKYLVNEEDAYKYSAGLKNKIPIKCSDCGYERKIGISNYINHGFGCPRCSDGIPYPEKFVFNVFEQVLGKENFITQLSKTTFKWCNKYKYDFYINKINGIVETMGLQHYEETKSKHWQSLEEIQENDKDKEELARENNIDNYIIIDCRKSDMNWIKSSIMNSEPNLPQLLNFKEEDINWLKCHESGCKNLVKVTCDLWNSGIKNTSKIAEQLKLYRSTISNYLKQGAKLGWCDYDPKKESKNNLILIHKTNCTRIICLTTGEIFNSINEASNKYNINYIGISSCCVKRIQSSGLHPETSERMVWMYYDEYILLTEEQIKNIISNLQYNFDKRIICLTTNEVFDSQKEAGERYNIKSNRMSQCCSHKTKSAGVHPETGEKLVWMKYNEYLINNK